MSSLSHVMDEMLQFRRVTFTIWYDVAVSVTCAAPESMSILGAYFADIHGAWGMAWGDVGSNDRTRMLWGDVWFVIIVVVEVVAMSVGDVIQCVIVV